MIPAAVGELLKGVILFVPELLQDLARKRRLRRALRDARSNYLRAITKADRDRYQAELQRLEWELQQ